MKDRIAVIWTDGGYRWSNEGQPTFIVMICSGDISFSAVWPACGEMESRECECKVQYMFVLECDFFRDRLYASCASRPCRQRVACGCRPMICEFDFRYWKPTLFSCVRGCRSDSAGRGGSRILAADLPPFTIGTEWFGLIALGTALAR